MGEFALAQSDSRSRTHFEREGWEIDLPVPRGENWKSVVLTVLLWLQGTDSRVS
jgi:hypothetical protein